MRKKDTTKDKKLRNKPHRIEEKNHRVVRFIQHLFGYINGRALQHMSLRKQLLIPIVSVMVIVSIIGASFSYIYGARMIREQLTNATRQQLNATDQTFNTYFDDAQSVVRQFTINPMLNNVDKNFNQIQKDFENVLSSNTKYQALTYASAKKDIVRSPLYFFSSSYDPTAERWYQEGAAGKGKSIWTDPYIDQVTKQNVVSVEQAVVDGDRVKGVIKMDLFIQSLVREVSASKLGDNGHAALLDSKGTYIASADQDEVGKSAAKQDFYKKMHQMGKSGSFYATIDGVKRLVVFKTNKISGWTLLGIIDNGEIANKANLIALPSVLTILIIIAVAILYIIYVFGIMLKRLKKIQRAAGKIEKGDLTVVIPIEGKDEFAQLTHSINALAHANRQALKKMADVSQQIAGASQTLVASSEENVASANEIAATVTEIAAGASNQSASIDESQASLQELLQQVNQIDQQSKEALTGANQMKDHASGGRAKMNHLSSQSMSSADTTRKIITTVQKLDEHAKNVHQIVDVLDGIARRTNLLSLNASIEAAHAGEHGKGFAVVAGEIRKLAQQTNVSLKEVTASVQSMNEEIKQAVAYCDETATVLQGQTDAVSESDHAFKEIEKTIQQNVKGLETIADAIIMTHQQIEQVTQGAQTIAATSEETAASTEEMSASVQEQTASMEELNRLAGELEQQAQTMQEEIKRFKI